MSSIVVDSGGGINSYTISDIIDDNYGGECVNSIIVNKECVNSELNVNFVQNEYVNENESSGDSDWKDTVTDDDYIPSEEPMSSDEYDSDIEDLSFKLRNERTLFVYQSKLYELLRFCPKGGPLDQSMIEEVKNTGSQLHLKITCFNNCTVEWKSQPEIGALKGLGNLFISTSIVFSGLSFAKFQRFAWLLNLKFISDSVFYQLRRDFILPVIRNKWKKERQYMLKLLKKRDLVVLVGDGSCDPTIAPIVRVTTQSIVRILSSKLTLGGWLILL